jgi:hypothetical protein
LRHRPLSHLVGIALPLAIGVASLITDWRPLTIGVLATGALVATATWEWFSLNVGWQQWAPWIGPRAAIALEESDG